MTRLLHNIVLFSVVGLWSVLFLFFVSPQFLPFEYSKMLVFIVCAVLAIVGAGVILIRRGSIALPSWQYVVAVPLLWLALLVSVIGRPGAGALFWGQGFEIVSAVALMVLTLLTLVTAFEFRSIKKIELVHKIALWVGAALAAFHISRLLFGVRFLSFGLFSDVVSNTIGGWNEVGIFFGAIVVIVVSWLALKPVSRRTQWLLWALLVASLCLLVAVNFPPAWYAVGVAMLAVGVYSWSTTRRLPYLAGVVIVIGILCANPFFGGTISQIVRSSLSISFIDVRPSWSGTFDVARGAFSTNPIRGVGPSSFATAWELYRPDVNMTNFWSVPFSSGVGFVSTSVVETGLLGLVAWLVWLCGVLAAVWLLWRSRSRLVASDTDPEAQRVSGVVVAAVVTALYLWMMIVLYVPSLPLLAATFVSYGLAYAALGAVGAVSYREYVYGRTRMFQIASVIIIGALMLFSIVAAVVTVKHVVAQIYFSRATQEFAVQGNTEAGRASLARALAWGENDAHRRAQAEVDLASLNAIVSAITSEKDITDDKRQEIQNALQSAVMSARAAESVGPRNFLNTISVARVYEFMVSLGVENSYETALDAYARALTQSPRNPLIYLSLARLEIAHKDLAKARDYTTRALELKPNYIDAMFLLSQIDVTQGNLPSAIDATEKLALINPSDPGIFFRLGLLRYEEKSYTNAVLAFEKALALAADYANARYFLGLSYYNVGRPSDARAQFEVLVKTNPDNEEVGFILDNLKAGRAPFEKVQPPLDNKPAKRSTPPVKEIR